MIKSPVCLLLAISTLPLGFAVPARGQSADLANDTLAATLVIRSQSYCHVDNQSFSVQLSLQVRFVNISARPLILSKRIDPPPITRVSKTRQDGEAGKFELALNPDRFVSKNPANPPTGDSPDPDYFIVLAPRQTYDVKTSTTVLGTKSHGVWQHDFVSPGIHVLQVGISTWPYYGYEDVEGLRQKWAQFGDLQHGIVYTNFAPLRIPQNFKNPRCAIP